MATNKIFIGLTVTTKPTNSTQSNTTYAKINKLTEKTSATILVEVESISGQLKIEILTADENDRIVPDGMSLIKELKEGERDHKVLLKLADDFLRDLRREIPFSEYKKPRLKLSSLKLSL